MSLKNNRLLKPVGAETVNTVSLLAAVCDTLSAASSNCRQQISVTDSFDFESQSRLHHCETKTARDKSILLYWSVHIDVPAFFAAQMPVTTE